MFTLMRKFFKPVIWIVAVAFIGGLFFGYGMQWLSKSDPAVNAAKVGSLYVTRAEYDAAFQNHITQFTDFNDFPADVQKAVRRSVLDNLINQKIVMLQAQKEGVKVRDEEVAGVIHSSFIDESGRFDQEAYNQARRFHGQERWLEIEKDIAYRILNFKLYNLIIGSVKVTELEVLNFFNSLYRQYEIKSIFIDPAEMISYTEIADYYSENQELFYEPVKYTARHILVRTNPDSSAEELERAQIKINNIYTLVNRGDEPFESLALRYSEDPGSARYGGLLPEFQFEDMVEEFSTAVSRLEEDEVSPIIKTEFGRHIIKLENKRENIPIPIEEAEFEIKQALLNDTHWAKAEEKAQNVYDEIQAAQDFGLVAKRQSNSFTAMADGYVGWVARFLDPELFDENLLISAGELFIDNSSFLLPAVFESLVSAQKDEITKPFKSSKGYHIIKLLDSKPADTEKYQTFKSAVSDMVLDDKKQALWEKWIKSIRENYTIEYYIEEFKENED